jgi:hypothetical protein
LKNPILIAQESDAQFGDAGELLLNFHEAYLEEFYTDRDIRCYYRNV